MDYIKTYFRSLVIFDRGYMRKSYTSRTPPIRPIVPWLVKLDFFGACRKMSSASVI